MSRRRRNPDEIGPEIPPEEEGDFLRAVGVQNRAHRARQLQWREVLAARHKVPPNALVALMGGLIELRLAHPSVRVEEGRIQIIGDDDLPWPEVRRRFERLADALYLVQETFFEEGNMGRFVSPNVVDLHALGVDALRPVLDAKEQRSRDWDIDLARRRLNSRLFSEVLAAIDTDHRLEDLCAPLVELRGIFEQAAALECESGNRTMPDWHPRAALMAQAFWRRHRPGESDRAYFGEVDEVVHVDGQPTLPQDDPKNDFSRFFCELTDLLWGWSRGRAHEALRRARRPEQSAEDPSE